MFEYVKELFNEQIEINMKRFDSWQEKKEEVENEITKLSDFQYLKTELKVSKFWLLFSSCLPFAFLVTSIILNLGISFYVLIAAATSLSVMKIFQYGINISEIKKTLNNNYPDYLNLTSNQLFVMEKQLCERKEMIVKHVKNIEEYISNIIQYLDMFNQGNLQEYFSSGDGLCLRDAKNHGELDELRKRKQFCSDLIDSYLDEKIDYSNIHFNSKIEESIGCIENNKKLIKKM